MKKLMNSVILCFACLIAHADVTMEMAKMYFSPEALNSSNTYVAESHRYPQKLFLRDFIKELHKTKNWPVRYEVETYVARSVLELKITPNMNQWVLRDRASMYSGFADATCKGGINRATINILALYLPKVPRGKESGHEPTSTCFEGGSASHYVVDIFRRSIVHMIATGLADLSDQEEEEEHITNIGKILVSAQIDEHDKFYFDMYYKQRIDALKNSKKSKKQ